MIGSYILSFIKLDSIKTSLQILTGRSRKIAARLSQKTRTR